MKNTIKAIATSALLLTSTFASAAEIKAEDIALKAAWEEVEYELDHLKQETTITECEVLAKPFKFVGNYYVTIGHVEQERRRNILGSIIPEIDVKLVVKFDSARAAMDFYNTYNSKALGWDKYKILPPEQRTMSYVFSVPKPLTITGKPGSFGGSVIEQVITKGMVVLRDHKVVESKQYPPKTKELTPAEFAKAQREWEKEENEPGRDD